MPRSHNPDKILKSDKKSVAIGSRISREEYEKYVLPILLAKNINPSQYIKSVIKYMYYLHKYPILCAYLDYVIESGILDIRELIKKVIEDVISTLKQSFSTEKVNIENVNVNIDKVINQVQTLIEKVDYLLQAQSIEHVVIFSIPSHIISKAREVIDIGLGIVRNILDEKSRFIERSWKSIITFKLGGMDRVVKNANKIIKDLESKYKMDIYKIIEKTNSKEIRKLVQLRDTFQQLRSYAIENNEISDRQIREMLISLLN